MTEFKTIEEITRDWPDFGDLPSDEELETEESRAKKAELERRRRIKGQICRCGHPMVRHSVSHAGGKERTSCEDRRFSTCDCRKAEGIVKVTDTRLFLQQTTGPGSQHALAKGMRALLDREAEYTSLEGYGTPGFTLNKSYRISEAFRKALLEQKPQFEWLSLPLRCDACGEPQDTSPIPTPVDASGKQVDSSKEAAINLLLCIGCYKSGRRPWDKEQA